MTLPKDNFGLPHILEHSVLGGSRKYKVKDPFVEMLKMSMATYLNAHTYPDRTVYPLASNVEKDFFNLADVYCDAVFHPNLTENTFKQEGIHIEFSEKNNPQSPLIYKGIVYNEMKGVFSSPDNLVIRQTFKRLFPNSVYGKESGGDPEEIPNLQYSDFTRFYRKFYHPSNAKIFIYGNIPTIKHLEFLNKKLRPSNRKPQHLSIPKQKHWVKPRLGKEYYAVSPGERTKRKTFIYINWLLDNGGDPARNMEMEILELILVGHQAAPLRKALIDSKLGRDLFYSGYSGGILETVFAVGLRGSNLKYRDKMVRLVLETLQTIARQGVPRQVESAFHQMSYSISEVTSLYPLNIMENVFAAWNYLPDPLLLLQGNNS